MAQAANIFEEGVDRVQEAIASWGDDIEKAQKDLAKRRKRFEKDTEKRIKQFRKELRQNTYLKRAQSLTSDTRKQIDSRVEGLLARFQVASSADVRRIDRKLSQLTKKIKTLEDAILAKRPAA